MPSLITAGIEVLVVGRDKTLLSKTFPGVPACEYRDLALYGKNYDLLLHLAAKNNRAPADDTVYHSANVALLNDVVATAEKGDIHFFLNFCTLHALNSRARTAYARSKRLGAQLLRETGSPRHLSLYLPYVYGGPWRGRLAFLERLPRGVARLIFTTIAAFKPTIHCASIVNFILSDAYYHATVTDDIIIADNQDNNHVYAASKRCIDLLFVALISLLFWWLFCLIWIFIRIDSRGPALFVQDRIGRNGKTFKCYKFRTMKVCTPTLATHHVSADAVTRVGRFLRATKLDELPQIVNILRNDMSLVGPRPSLPTQSQVLLERIARGVLAVKPGITGLSQINKCDMSAPVALAQMDALYIRTRTILLDIYIIICTVMGAGSGDRLAH